jgi:predicted transcriptional regulator
MVTVVFLVSPEIRKRMEKLAASNERTLSGEIRLALAHWVGFREAA